MGGEGNHFGGDNEGAMETDHPIGGGWRDGDYQGGLSGDVPQIQREADEPSKTSSKDTDELGERVVVWFYGHGEEQTPLGAISGTLPEGTQQVVVRLQPGSSCRYRGMESEERVYGIRTQDMGGQVSFYRTNQGWIAQEDTTDEDYSDVEL